MARQQNWGDGDGDMISRWRFLQKGDPQNQGFQYQNGLVWMMPGYPVYPHFRETVVFLKAAPKKIEQYHPIEIVVDHFSIFWSDYRLLCRFITGFMGMYWGYPGDVLIYEAVTNAFQWWSPSF